MMVKTALRAALILPSALSVLTAECAVAADQPTAPAVAPSESQESMAAEIKALRQRLDDLETKERQVANQRAQQQTAAAVQADAEKQGTGISTGGFSGGYKENRFYIQNEDGSITLRPWLHMQFRDSTNFRNSGSGGSDDWQNGFELRRARFGFDGNLTQNVLYSFDWATYRGNSGGTTSNGGTFQHLNGGTPVLEEAWVLYHFNDTPWSVRAGQMHDPLDHESIVGSKYRSPEISLQGDIFANTDTFTQAVTAIYDPKKAFRFEGGITDGIRAANTNFEDYPNNGVQYDFGFAGRAEYKISGDWKDYKQMTAHGSTKGDDLIVIGTGVDLSERGGSNSFSHTIDLQVVTAKGWFVYASYFGRYINDNPGIYNGAPVSTSVSPTGSPGGDTYEYSLLGQVAKVVDKNWEPYVRAEYLQLAGTPSGSKNNVFEVSVGANYYLVDHNLKLTSQLMYLPNGIPINDDSNDVLINNGRGEVVFMEQLQLLL